MSDSEKIKILNISESISSRFNVKKIIYKVKLIGSDIEGSLDELLNIVKDDEFKHIKIGLSISCQRCLSIHVEFRHKANLTGQFLLNRFDKLAQSNFNLFECENYYVFTFTLLAAKK